MIESGKEFKLNIQLFADEGGSGGSGDPGAGNEGQTGNEGAAGETGNPQPQGIEIPEYLNNYVSGIEDEGQREFISGLLGDERAVNLLKGFIPDPNAEWTVKADDYKEDVIDVAGYIEESKKNGTPEIIVKSFLENRKAYITNERAKMTPEMIALDGPINNFISAEQDAEIQGVYARLAENAAGRKVLKQIMESRNPKSPGITGGGNGSEAYDYKSFVEAYNDAKPVNGEPDKAKLRALETFARNSEDPYFRDFLGIK